MIKEGYTETTDRGIIREMKRKKAKEILAESFYELSESRDIDKITVKEITDNCGYSPATFYRHFRDKYDLIAWAYTENVEAIMSRIGEDDYSWAQTLLDGARFFAEEKDFLTNLFLHTGGHDAFIRYMTDINFEALRKVVIRANGGELPDGRIEQYIRVYSLGTVSLTCEWVLGRFEATPEELAEIFENALPLPLHKYLCVEDENTK